MDEYNRKRGIKYLSKEEEYSLYILIEGNEFLLLKSHKPLDLYKNGKNIYKTSNNVTIIKNEKEVIIWKSDENIIVDKYLFKERFEQARIDCKQTLFNFMNENNTYDKPTLDCIDYTFEEFYNDMYSFVFGDDDE